MYGGRAAGVCGQLESGVVSGLAPQGVRQMRHLLFLDRRWRTCCKTGIRWFLRAARVVTRPPPQLHSALYSPPGLVLCVFCFASGYLIASLFFIYRRNFLMTCFTRKLTPQQNIIPNSNSLMLPGSLCKSISPASRFFAALFFSTSI